MNSKKCEDKGCLNHKQYDGSLSAAYKPTNHHLDVEFGTGKLHGLISKDTFFIDNLQINSQYFAEIQEEDGEVFYEVLKLIKPKFIFINSLIFSQNLMGLWEWLFQLCQLFICPLYLTI